MPTHWEYNTPMDHSKLVVVHTCGNHPEADLAANMLEAAGIPAMVQGDTAGGMREHLAWSGQGFKILVREEDANSALELLKPAEGKLVTEDGGSFDAEYQGNPEDSAPWRKFT